VLIAAATTTAHCSCESRVLWQGEGGEGCAGSTLFTGWLHFRCESLQLQMLPTNAGLNVGEMGWGFRPRHPGGSPAVCPCSYQHFQAAPEFMDRQMT